MIQFSTSYVLKYEYWKKCINSGDVVIVATLMNYSYHHLFHRASLFFR